VPTKPIIADAIDFPAVAVGGLIVLIPLLAFEVLVEAFVLKKAWKMAYRSLCKFAFIANVLSLLAGVPTEFLNSAIDPKVLPADIPGYFTRYPAVTAIDSLIYFIVTIVVEGLYAVRWLRRQPSSISRGMIWTGVIFANVASYAVVAPLNYLATRPNDGGLRYASETRWTTHPAQTMLFVDDQDHFLKSIQLDGSHIKTVVGVPMTDYLISSNLDVCLFRGINGALYLFRLGHPKPEQIWTTKEKFFMAQVAFSPSGNRVAYVSDDGNTLQLYDAASGKRVALPLARQSGFYEASVAWSLDENRFYVRGVNNGASIAVSVKADGSLASAPLSATNGLQIEPCFGRLASARFFGNDWGVIYHEDRCGQLSAVTWLGLDSNLRITQGDAFTSPPLQTVSVRPGLLHLAGFYFGDVAFLDDCNECLFEANGCIYVLDVKGKRVGTLTSGDRFILLTPRYLKTL
jgi:hypothetical protein